MSSDAAPQIIRQCATCPWKVTTVPDRDIPNGYHVELHESLRDTIQTGLESLFRTCKTAMACHYSKPGEEFACAGWLHNQLGPGNNISVRIEVATGRMPVPEVDGDQHERFEDTLPKKRRKKETSAARSNAKSPKGK